MNNKETLQQNNSRLNINNVDLTSILNTINNLPENVEIKLQEKSVIPTTSQQEVVADEGYTGLSKITVKEIAENSIEITPSLEEQNFNGVYTDIKVEKITGDSIEINPSSENQNFNGIYTDVTVLGDSNLVADNIKQGVSIFGVEGSLKASTSSAKITDASYLFYNNARLDNLENLLELCDGVTTTYYMFGNCSQLRELDLSNFDTSNVTNMQNMFYNCNSLTQLNINNFDTHKVTNMKSMFDRCMAPTLDLSSFDMSNVQIVSYMFDYYSGLVALNSFKNLGKGYTKTSNNYSNYTLDLSDCKQLTHGSLIDVITNGLYDLNLTYDVANGGTLYTQQLILGSTNLAKLTAEEINIATNKKGWSVS